MGGLEFLFYLLSFGIGGLVGASELISRYRDAPFQALRTYPALLYVAINGLASCIAFGFIREFHWLQDIVETGAPAADAKRLLLQALVAGGSAMVLFRASFFTVRVGRKDIGIGPAAILHIFLEAADRECDRARAGPRADAIEEIMADISFEKASTALPMLCLELMQNVNPDEEEAMANTVQAIQRTKTNDAVRANLLGLNLMNVVGERVLRSAVEMLRRDLKASPKLVTISTRTMGLLQSAALLDAREIVNACMIVTNKGDDKAFRSRLEKTLETIAALPSDDNSRMLLLSRDLVNNFGEEALTVVLESLPAADPPPHPPNVVPIKPGK